MAPRVRAWAPLLGACAFWLGCGTPAPARPVPTLASAPPSAAHADAAPALAATCPDGTERNGSTCASRPVIPQTQCNEGTRWNGSQCVAVPPPQPAPSSCPAGMVPLAGGSYAMANGGPFVTVQPFCIDATEVTVTAYAACVKAGRCGEDHPGQTTADGKHFSADARCNSGVNGRGDHPMNCVDWAQAWTYCKAVGKRLPMEEEWEWAARGGDLGRTYPWGSTAPDVSSRGPGSMLCWSAIPAPRPGEAAMPMRDSTCPVGSFPEGDAPGGIHDLLGNVWEWTGSSSDPSNYARVTRGGGWSNVNMRDILARFTVTPEWRERWRGFRCAR